MTPLLLSLLAPLLANLILATLLWLFATWKQDVSLVDLLWPLFFVLSAWIWFEPDTASIAQWTTLLLVMAWGGRLHIHLALRNLGHGEDRRYQAIRRNNSPGFWWKSYFIVFVLQAVLAWLAALAIHGALAGDGVGVFSVLGGAIALFGLLFEAVADEQLRRFRASSANRGQVMRRGLWHLCRHPNYFGECVFWWGIYLMALPAGWWAIVSPLLLTVLLLRVSGVSLLEQDIHQRRPGYRDYVQNTPAFIPDFSRCLRGGQP